MKKIIGLMMLFISSYGFAQTKEELLKSKDFQQYVVSVFQMSLNIGTKFSSDQRQALIQEFESRKYTPMTDAQQFEFISSRFKFRDVNTFRNFYDSLNTVWNKLETQYGNIDQQALTDAASVLLEGRVPTCENRIRFALCSASVTAQGTLMFAACEGGTVGIGTPVCIAAVVAYTANGIAECHDRWCKKTTVAL